MNSTIIELRQGSSQTIEPGHFVTILDKPLQVQAGDVIGLRAAFVDARASSGGTIVIEEDIETILSFICWVQDWIDTDKNYGVPANKLLSGYFLGCNGSSKPAGDLEEITEIEFQSDRYEASGWGGMNVSFTYKDDNDKPASFSIWVPSQNLGKKFRTNPNVICMKGTWYIQTTGKELEAYNVRYAGIKDTKPVNTGSYSAVQFHSTLTIPSGDYQPDSLANESG